MKRIVILMLMMSGLGGCSGSTPAPAAKSATSGADRKYLVERFAGAARTAQTSGAQFPLARGEALDALLKRLEPMFFDPAVDPIVTSKTPPPGKDILTASANNLYAGVSMKDLAGYHEAHPLN